MTILGARGDSSVITIYLTANEAQHLADRLNEMLNSDEVEGDWVDLHAVDGIPGTDRKKKEVHITIGTPVHI